MLFRSPGTAEGIAVHCGADDGWLVDGEEEGEEKGHDLFDARNLSVYQTARLRRPRTHLFLGFGQTTDDQLTNGFGL